MEDDYWGRIDDEPQTFSVAKDTGWDNAFNHGVTVKRTIKVSNKTWGALVLPCIEEVQGGNCAPLQFQTYDWYDTGDNGDEVEGDGIFTNEFEVGNEETCRIWGNIKFISPSAALSNSIEYDYTFIR